MGRIAILLLIGLLIAAILIMIPTRAEAENIVVSDETIVTGGTTIIEAAPTPVPKQVHIRWENGSLPTVIKEGTALKIVSELVGFDGLDVTYVWQADMHDGNGFVTLVGEDRSFLIIHATEESLNYDYRLVIQW